MKTNLISTAVAALALAATGYAQTAKSLQVSVPFDFVAAGRTLPAGDYSVSQPVNTSAIAIRSAGGGVAGVVAIANRVESPGRVEIGKLVFTRYGDRYFLSQVWGTDSSAGSELRKTSDELEAAQVSQRAVSTVVIAKR